MRPHVLRLRLERQSWRVSLGVMQLPWQRRSALLKRLGRGFEVWHCAHDFIDLIARGVAVCMIS